MQDNTTPSPDNDMIPAGSPPLPERQVQPPSSRSSQSFDAMRPAERLTQTPPNTDTTSPFVANETEITKPTESSQDQDATPQDSPVKQPLASSPAPKKPSKKKVIIGGIIAGALVILGGGGAAAYNLWYQNPDKVLGEALVNALQADTLSATGTYSFETKEADASMAFLPSKIKVAVDGKGSPANGVVNATLNMTYGGENITVSGSGLYDTNANLYLKVKDIRKALDTFATDEAPMPKAYTDVINKVDGKWIKISSADTKEYSKEYADTQVCLKDTIKKISNDKEATNEIVDLYTKNKFIQVDEKLGSKGNSLGYRVQASEDKARKFVDGLNGTTFLKELQKCDENFKIDYDDVSTGASSDSSTKSRGETHFDVWVDRWSHQITELNLTDKDKGYETTATLKPVFNAPVNVTAPKEFINLAELKQEIDVAVKEYTASMTSSVMSTYEGASSTQADRVSASIESYRMNNKGAYPTLQQLLASDSSLTEIVSSESPTPLYPERVQYELRENEYSIGYYDAKSGSTLTFRVPLKRNS